VIEPDEADVIRRILQLAVDGLEIKAIAKTLNREGALSPRAQQGRPQTWAPSSVWAALHRQTYRGESVYGATAKRDKWGQKHQAPRPESEWIRSAALAIVTPDVWNAAHARMDAARAVYIKGTSGQAFGRPALGNPSKYLLTNLANCGFCNGPLQVISSSHGSARKRFYGCSGHRDRGTCGNGRWLPMADGDDMVLEALLDDVLDESIVADAIDEALALVTDDADQSAQADRLDRQLAQVAGERAHLMGAINAGEQLAGLLEALRALDRRERDLGAARSVIAARVRADPLIAAAASRPSSTS
jgi:site-specific DNA recombinase